MALAALWRRAEDGLVSVMLLAMGLLPVLEIGLRTLFAVGIPGNAVYVSNLTLWVGFLGAMIAAREIVALFDGLCIEVVIGGQVTLRETRKILLGWIDSRLLASAKLTA